MDENEPFRRFRITKMCRLFGIVASELTDFGLGLTEAPRCLAKLSCQHAMHGHSAASAIMVTVMVWLCSSQRPDAPGGAISP